MIDSLSPGSRLLLSELIGTDPRKCKSQCSIFLRLRHLLEGEDTKLDPSPVLNSILTKLVSLLRGDFCSSFTDFGHSFSDLEREVCGEIDRDEQLQSRADFIRNLAMQAEFRLELYHVRYMLSRSLTSVTFCPLEKVKAACWGFPYIDNYINMVQKESRFISKFIRDGGEHKNPVTIIDNGEGHGWTRSVAFCGSGPLPLTGILMAICLRIRVILVDSDEDAVDMSRKLIRYWEKEKVIPTGVITVICAKGENLIFCNPDSMLGPRADNRVVPCHVLFIAALIPNEAKEVMVRKISELAQAGPLVVMRTAHGLTARFAYFQTRRKIMTKYLHLIGIVAPETHRDDNGFVVDDHVPPLGFFSSDILNSLELYSWQQSQHVPCNGNGVL